MKTFVPPDSHSLICVSRREGVLCADKTCIEFVIESELKVSEHLLAKSKSDSDPISIDTVTDTIFSKTKIVY